jgi:uncharacterized DUF497 family protein
MDFEWNEAKRELNLAKHGVDIFVAALIFEGQTITTEDKRHDYGEVRHKSVGMVDDVCYVVIHTNRNGVTRLISAWEGGRRDRRKLEAGIAG